MSAPEAEITIEGSFRTSPGETDYLKYIGICDDGPRERARRMTIVGENALSNYFPTINRAFNNDPPRENIAILKSLYFDGSVSHLGLSYEKYGEQLFGHVADVGDRLTRNGLEQEEVLRRLGNASGVLIAQGQLFTSANKRTARAARGFVIDGMEGMLRAINQEMLFKPPENVEELILRQNMTRLMSGHDETGDLTDIIEADWKLEDILDKEEQRVALIANRDGLAGRHPEIRMKDQKKRLFSYFAHELDEPAADNLSTILQQKWYGPAALAIVGEGKSLDSLTKGDVAEIMKVNDQLLQMRLKSLVNGMINDGEFPIVIEDWKSEYFWLPDVDKTIVLPTKRKASEPGESTEAQTLRAFNL